MEGERTASAWIARPLVDSDGVATLRDHLYGWLEAPEPYRREDDLHVSVFGIRLPADRATDFEVEFDAFAESVGNWRGRTDGYHLHPSARNPMVVALDVPSDIEGLASPIADLLARHDGRVGRGPHPAHITLFKGGVRGEELQWAQLDESTRDRLAAVLGDGDNRLNPPTQLVKPSLRIELSPPELEWN